MDSNFGRWWSCLPAHPNQNLDFLSGIQTTFERAKTPVGVAMLACCACIDYLVQLHEVCTASEILAR